jgi:hypothetical protein
MDEDAHSLTLTPEQMTTKHPHHKRDHWPPLC